MTTITVQVAGPITLPSGISVGDEFRIAGKVRVTVIAENVIDAGMFSDGTPQVLPGSKSYTLLLSEVTPA